MLVGPNMTEGSHFPVIWLCALRKIMATLDLDFLRKNSPLVKPVWRDLHLSQLTSSAACIWASRKSNSV